MSDTGMLMKDTSRDCETGGAKTSTKPCRHASSTRWGLHRVLVAASAVAALALLACVLLRPAGPVANADEEPLQVADVPATEMLASSACDQYPYLKFVKMVHSNLGRRGPMKGEEGLVFLTKMVGRAAGAHAGEYVELVLHAISPYKPAAPGANGMQGEYGSVNIMHGTHVDIMFSVRHAKTKQPMRLPHLALTFFDLDQGPGGHCQESVTVGGFHRVILTPKTEVRQAKQFDGRTKFMSSTFGTGDDNPKNPMYLTEQQKNRAVSIIFENFHTHKVTLGATAGVSPRFFTFIGRPSLLCAATVQTGYHPPATTQPPKYPVLHYGPLGLQPVPVPPGKTFDKWYVDLHDRVKKGDPLAELTTMTVKSPHDGMIIAKVPLQHGDIIDQRMVDHNIATIDERLPPLEVDAAKGEQGEAAPRVRYFVRWLKDVDDEVTVGEPIAQVSTINPLRNVGLGTVTTVKATESGIIKAREPMEPGDAIGEVQQNVYGGQAFIAVVALEPGGTPWWAWLLLALLALCIAACCILLFCCKKKESPRETYKQLPAEQPVVVPPPPPAVKPHGLRLDFDDHNGTIHTVLATMRPLGIKAEEKCPIDVVELTFNSYAKTLGVKPGWTIVRVGDMVLDPASDYGEAEQLINTTLRDYPLFPFKMELIKADNKEKNVPGMDEKRDFDMYYRPFGFEFDNKAPIRVKKTYPNSYAESLQIKDYLSDRESWAICKLGEHPCPPDDRDFPKIFAMMKEGSMALDPWSAEDGVRSKDQLRGWDA